MFGIRLANCHPGSAVAGGGVVTGIMAGLFGIGGGAVIGCRCFTRYSVRSAWRRYPMQLCNRTSLAIIVPTTVPFLFTTAPRTSALMTWFESGPCPPLRGMATGATVAAVALPRSSAGVAGIAA